MLKKCLTFSALVVFLMPRPSEGRVVRLVTTATTHKPLRGYIC